jgi:hypothetical protein
VEINGRPLSILILQSLYERWPEKNLRSDIEVLTMKKRKGSLTFLSQRSIGFLEIGFLKRVKLLALLFRQRAHPLEADPWEPHQSD